ncbi:transcriptional regulator, Crp/Fnr family [Caminicella sporogenes DSM 14501]|uniref:Transcriptional regulator, Crp/Fnr family n=1 Tax=Caminicella sporogenes DSM 14501 TaxID=1121266 RepID=A0A1M6SLY9_9FIRM|nr:Crp/Fnr family transcriptional regulator [Caminicella sporogenes]RKD26541.1 cAMP-binding protein [Caminicella sporogenes]WIF95370.1 Crp/Fnr family transcriptional regulator [Caminicella sporogenes]SHK45804.1 transcriptional regulator, Crp/Fnr family [Caminicella sporogenes DSM 14501]
MNSIDTLRKVPFFSKLDTKDLQKILSITIEKKFKKGSIIFMEGDKGNAFYFIKSGKVKIYKTSKEGKDLILGIFGNGNVFAEVTIFNDINYPATAEVIEDAIIGIIRNEDLEKLIKNNSDMSLNLIKVLSKRLYKAQSKLKQIALDNAFHRAVEVLINLYETSGNQNSENFEIKLEISREELGNMIGTSRETVSRILSNLKKDDIIDVSGRKIIIKNIEKLMNFK